MFIFLTAFLYKCNGKKTSTVVCSTTTYNVPTYIHNITLDGCYPGRNHLASLEGNDLQQVYENKASHWICPPGASRVCFEIKKGFLFVIFRTAFFRKKPKHTELDNFFIGWTVSGLFCHLVYYVLWIAMPKAQKGFKLKPVLISGTHHLLQ